MSRQVHTQQSHTGSEKARAFQISAPMTVVVVLGEVIAVFFRDEESPQHFLAHCFLVVSIEYSLNFNDNFTILLFILSVFIDYLAFVRKLDRNSKDELCSFFNERLTCVEPASKQKPLNEWESGSGAMYVEHVSRVL